MNSHIDQNRRVVWSAKRRRTKGRARFTLISAALVVLGGIAIAGQQQQQIDPIHKLREQIEKMESIDRDPATAPEVRALNREFLKQRRLELKHLLADRISSLQKYLATIGSALTAEEHKQVQASVKELQVAIDDLENTNSQSELFAARPQGQEADGTTQVNSDSANITSGRSSTPISTANVTTASRGPIARLAPPASAQGAANCYPDAPPVLVDQAKAAANSIVDNQDDPTQFFGYSPRLVFYALADAISQGEKANALVRQLRVEQFIQETKRTDKQIGASATAAGSTSAVEKPGFANLLGFAIENGTIQKNVTGTTLTLSSSPYAFVAAAKGDTTNTYQQYDFLNRVGVSANFNIGNQDDLLSNVRRRQLSEWSIRLRFSKDQSARSQEFENFWNDKIRDRFERVPIILTGEFAQTFKNETEQIRQNVEAKFTSLDGKSGLIKDYLNKNATLTPDQKKAGLQQELLCQLKEEVFDKVSSGSIKVDEETRERIVKRTIPELVSAQLAEKGAVDEMNLKLKAMQNRPLMTFAYTNKRETSGSDYSIFKFLYEKKTFSPMKVDANADFSIYHRPNRTLNQQSLRDFAVALSFQGTAGRSPFLTAELDQSPITFSFTGRYERILENRHQSGRKADIAVGQFKLEIPLFTGISIPFSLTLANASELIKERHVGAHFGFTLDTDKLLLLTKLKPQ